MRGVPFRLREVMAIHRVGWVDNVKSGTTIKLIARHEGLKTAMVDEEANATDKGNKLI